MTNIRTSSYYSRKAITGGMINEIIREDLFPAGFTATLVSYYYGDEIFAAKEAMRRRLKSGDLKKIKVIARNNTKIDYYYYK